MSNARAMRYRKLALAEKDRGKADLLFKLADECERGVLCTATWLSARSHCNGEKPPQDIKAGFGWEFLNPRR
jgi:hypothetical protein